ncbi:hypothetical protein D3C81_1656350 [compost metagenome]
MDFARHVARLHGVAAVLLHRGCQLLHARRRLLQGRRLRFRATRQVHIAGGDFLAGHADAQEIAAHVADDGMQIHAQLAQGTQQLPHLVAPRGVEFPRQVAARHHVAGLARLLQRLQHGAVQAVPEIQGRAQGQHG